MLLRTYCWNISGNFSEDINFMVLENKSNFKQMLSTRTSWCNLDFSARNVFLSDLICSQSFILLVFFFFFFFHNKQRFCCYAVVWYCCFLVNLEYVKIRRCDHVTIFVPYIFWRLWFEMLIQWTLVQYLRSWFGDSNASFSPAFERKL